METMMNNAIGRGPADLYEKAPGGGLTDAQERLARTWTFLDEDLPDDSSPMYERHPEYIDYIREHRLSYAGGDVRRYDLRQQLPNDVVAFTDIPYIGDGARAHLLDVYLPKEAYLRGDADIPTIFDIHGGAFFYSFKEIMSVYVAQLASRGFAVVCPNYTLAPGGDFLDMLADVSAALSWVGEHEGEYQLNRSQLFLSCDSAGALLGLFLLATQGDEELARLLGLDRRSAPMAFRSAGFCSGMLNYDHLFDTAVPDSKGLFDSLLPMFDRLRERLDGTAFERTENLLETLDRVPPMWLCTSTDDFLEEDSLRMAITLRRLGVDHQLVDLRSSNGRRLPHDYPLMTWDDGAAPCMDSILTFFREHMSPRIDIGDSM
ncbi:esterase [Bifidobacterium eulemuris]|uniref:Alpha/beta hydrolase n=2 Tax=Bifidobacterium eulemuris TaxID=1765219 RepID=A0A261G1I2_9BIFI|nr:esterase [Bifidobacterium eulemuris]QOL32303.1 alpha/beta hydrolase [Bifidobacterium eulemuris]